MDRSAIGALEATLKSAEERSSPGSKILAATFYLHVEQHGRARAYIDKVLETNPDDVQALIVSGWIDLLLPRNSKRNIEKIHSSVEIFNRVLELSGTKKELEALMGKARYHMNKREYEAATESLNQAMVMYPWFVPALLEKAIILLMQDEYEGAVELCEKVLEQDPTNVQCLRLIPLMNLTREYNPSSAAANIAKLAKSLEYDEPNNPRLYFNIARPLARLAGGSNQVSNANFWCARHPSPSITSFFLLPCCLPTFRSSLKRCNSWSEPENCYLTPPNSPRSMGTSRPCDGSIAGRRSRTRKRQSWMRVMFMPCLA